MGCLRARGASKGLAGLACTRPNKGLAPCLSRGLVTPNRALTEQLLNRLHLQNIIVLVGGYVHHERTVRDAAINAGNRRFGRHRAPVATRVGSPSSHDDYPVLADDGTGFLVIADQLKLSLVIGLRVGVGGIMLDV